MNPAKPCTDLTFATDDELVIELMRRYRNILIVAEYEIRNDDNRLGIIYNWSGGWTAGLGLAERARIKIQSEINHNTNPD